MNKLTLQFFFKNLRNEALYCVYFNRSLLNKRFEPYRMCDRKFIFHLRLLFDTNKAVGP